MISVSQLSKRYGSTRALDRLDLEVPVGSVMGLLGPNGAGKTTFLRLVMGMVTPDDGQIDRGGLPAARIGYLPERAFYPPRFRVREYLTAIGQLAGLRTGALHKRVEGLLGQLRLQDVAGQRLGSCSRGMLQRLGIAQALLGDPPLLLLDEPVAGLDPAGQKFIRDLIVRLQAAGKTVVLSSHNLGEVTRVCTSIAVLNRGRLAKSGPLAQVLPSRSQVVISTGPMPPELPPRLEALDPGIAASERRVVLSGDALLRKPDVLRLLLQIGVDIQQLAEQHATLEEVYLEATGE